MEKLGLSHIVGGNANGTTILENNLAILYRTTHVLAIQLNIHIPGHLLQRIEDLSAHELCTQMLRAYFVLAEDWSNDLHWQTLWVLQKIE